MNQKKNLLYISKTPLDSPLGESQVLAYLAKLPNRFSTYAISMEHIPNFRMVRRSRNPHIVQFLLPYNLISWPLLNQIAFIPRVLHLACAITWKRNISWLWCRSYLPTFVGLLVKKICLGRPKVLFDMRALWVDELIMIEKVSKDSLIEKALRYVEEICLRKSDSIVSLTHQAISTLEKRYPHLSHELTKSVVIRTCVADNYLHRRQPFEVGRLRLAIVGSVTTGWFKLARSLAIFNQIANLDPDIEFYIITRDQLVYGSLDISHRLSNRLKIISMTTDQVIAFLGSCAATLMIFNVGEGKHGSFPTRFAESLAAGCPVITNDSMLDLTRLLADNPQCGFSFSESMADELIAVQIIRFIGDSVSAEALSRRGYCRAFVKNNLTVSKAVDRYSGIFDA